MENLFNVLTNKVVVDVENLNTYVDLLETEVFKDDNLNGNTKLELIKSFDKVFSLDLVKENKLSDKHDYIIKKIEERNVAKKNKDYELADSIREELASEGIILVDTREGTTYKMEE